MNLSISNKLQRKYHGKIRTLILANVLVALPAIALAQFIDYKIHHGYGDLGLFLPFLSPLYILTAGIIIWDFIVASADLYGALRHKDFQPLHVLFAAIVWLVIFSSATFVLWSVVWNNRQEVKSQQLLTRQQAVDLVQSCKLTSFTETDLPNSYTRGVYVTYKDMTSATGNTGWAAHLQLYTSINNWQAMTSAADQAAQHCGTITYTLDLQDTIHKWITLDTAQSLLLHCEIDSYGFPLDPAIFGPLTGSYTGYEYAYAGNTARHIYADPTHQAQLQPAIQAAQQKCQGAPLYQ